MAESNTNAAPRETNDNIIHSTNGRVKNSIEEVDQTGHQFDRQEIYPRHSPQQSNEVTHHSEHAYGNGLSYAQEVDSAADSAFANETASSAEEAAEQHIQAYAKIEFADGDFYMTTHAVELGRDQDTTSIQTNLRGAKLSNNQSTDSIGGSAKSQEEQGDGRILLNGSQNFEENGQRPPSTTSSSINAARPRRDYNALAVSPPRDPDPEMNDANMDGFDLSRPQDCPLIPIFSPPTAQGRMISHKSISRRHARIAFNFDKHYFEILFLGRNGGFLDEEWFPSSDIQPLVNGSIIQIGGLGMRFVLPDVPRGETGAEEVERDLYGDESMEEDSFEDEEESKEEDSPDEEPEQMATRGRGRARMRHEPEPDPEPVVDPTPSRKKGPGRPPKNGVMSKREQKATKQAKEDKKPKPQKKSVTASGRGKGKTAKLLALEESQMQTNGKRKYTKRKRPTAEEERKARESSAEKTESVAPEQSPATKPPKDKRPPKPPRSPSPVWVESELTAEQLAKPQASYVILIHEALTNSKTGAMSLPQIYRAIERKYPYFKLRVTTQGWQSSVRHNLGQHAAFRKIERDGKGWMWGYDPDVSIEKEKKRRATPPPQTASQPRYYPQQQAQPPRPNYPYSNVPYPGTHGGQYPPNNSNPLNGYGAPPGMQNGQLPPRPPFGPPAFPMILNANKSESTYRSPYDTSPTTTQQTPQSTPQSQPIPTSNGIHNTQPSQHPYGNHVPAPTNPYTQHHPPWPPKPQPSPQTPAAATSASSDTQISIQKFKTALLNDMDSTPEAERMIDSAIDRTLGKSTSSTIADASDSDLSQEKTIMLALEKLLRDLGERNGIAGSEASEGTGGRAAEVAEQVVRSMPPPVPASASDGVGKAGKRERSASQEADGGERPLEKKAAVGVS